MQFNTPEWNSSDVLTQEQAVKNEAQELQAALQQQAPPREVQMPSPPPETSILPTETTETTTQLPTLPKTKQTPQKGSPEPSQDSSGVPTQEQAVKNKAQELQAALQQQAPREVQMSLLSQATSIVPTKQTPQQKEKPKSSQDSSGLGQTAHSQQSHYPKKLRARVDKRSVESSRMLEDQCRQLCLSLFFREPNPVRSLGFTSSIEGEGKSFLALVTARILAHDSFNPVTLVECNWKHPVLHERFSIPATPGLAEWLRGECAEKDIRYQVECNLTVIPAGDGAQDAVKLLKRVQQHGLLKIFGQSDELFIIDLPPIITTGYGSLAAGLPDSIVVVVRSQVTNDSIVREACARLEEVPIHGIILNQWESRIPQWIQQLL
jgi:protein-tyrosine kinase